MGIRVANKIRPARQTRQPTVSAAKTKQRYKKRRNCKHKKSGCVCFIVAGRCAVPLRNWGHQGQQGLLRSGRSDCKVTNQRKITQERSQQNQNYFFRFEHSIRQNAEQRNETSRSLQQTRGLFTIFPRAQLGAETICLLLPHHCAPTCPRACTRLQSFFDNCLHPSPPAPISLKVCTLGVKALHLFAVHRLHTKRVVAIRLHFNDKAPSVQRLGMGELRHFSSFTGTFTIIPLIFCNLQPVCF